MLRTTDASIHRNGRTARAMQAEFSMLMIPDEWKVVKALLNSLNRGLVFLFHLVITIDAKQMLTQSCKCQSTLAFSTRSGHRCGELGRLTMFSTRRTMTKSGWGRLQRYSELEVTRCATLCLASLFIFYGDSETENTSASKGRKENGQRVVMMKAELGEMISKPLIARGVSTKYITLGNQVFGLLHPSESL